MFNHVRTLLLNQDGALAREPEFLGEEAVPADYKAVALPTYLADLRRRLFGASPDRAMLNYRLAQYLAVLHSTELEEYVLAPDPRVTYRAAPRTDLFDPATYVPRLTQLAGPATTADLQGVAALPDASGQIYREAVLTITGPDAAEVQWAAPLPRQSVQAYTVTGGLSSRIDVIGGYGLCLRDPATGMQWLFQVYLRPVRDLGEILASLASVGEPTLLQLFGLGHAEPYQTFRNLYHQHRELPYRLGALLLAMAWRTDELRRTYGR